MRVGRRCRPSPEPDPLGPEPGGPSPSRTEQDHMLWIWAGAGPTTELSSQAVADLEPGGPLPSRTEREPTCPTCCGPRPEPDPRLSYQARPWFRSRAVRVRVGRSGSSPPLTWAGEGLTTELSSQDVTDPDSGGSYPNRTKREPTCPTRCGPCLEPDPRLSSQARPWSRSRTGRIRVGRSGSSLAPPQTWSGAGPTTELSSQAVADLEPGGPLPSRTEREPTCPTCCGPRPEPDPRLSYQARTRLSGAGLAESESEGAGSQHAVDLGRSRTQSWAGATTQGYTSVTRAKARTAVRQEATSKDPGLRSCLTWSRGHYPMYPDSDGF